MSHIMVWRGTGQEDGLTGFWHHGILCADGSVIHYTGMDGVKTLRNASIMRTTMEQFHCNSGRTIHYISYRADEHRHIYPPDQVQQRAQTRLGHQQYDLLFDNCESFARWCVVGEETSFQTQGYLVGAAAGIGSIIFGGGLLGAALTAVVCQKFWDRRANRSAARVPVATSVDDADSDTN